MLGAIDTVSTPVSDPVNIAYNPTGGAVDIKPVNTIPTGGGMVTLPTDTVTYYKEYADFKETGPSKGGGAAPDLREDTGVELPAEGPFPMSKKNLLLYGIGALVIGYLLLRKK